MEPSTIVPLIRSQLNNPHQEFLFRSIIDIISSYCIPLLTTSTDISLVLPLLFPQSSTTQSSNMLLLFIEQCEKTRVSHKAYVKSLQ